MSTEMRRWNEPVVTDWHELAVCRTRDVSPDVWALFDPVGLDEPKQHAWDRARLGRQYFCDSCPVMAECAAEGALHEYEGLWGGEFRERRGIIDLETGLVVRDLIEVRPEDLDSLDFDADDDDDGVEDIVEPEPVVDVEPEPEPEPVDLSALAQLPTPSSGPESPPEPARTIRPRRPRRIGFRRARRHRPPAIGVQLTLDEPDVPRRRVSQRRVVNDLRAGGRVAV